MSWTRGRSKDVPPRVRRFVLDRDKHTCVYCGNEASQVDHIVPWSEGGSDGPDNLQSLCVPCHAAKSRTERLRGAQRHLAKGRRPAEKHPSE